MENQKEKMAQIERKAKHCLNLKALPEVTRAGLLTKKEKEGEDLPHPEGDLTLQTGNPREDHQRVLKEKEEAREGDHIAEDQSQTAEIEEGEETGGEDRETEGEDQEIEEEGEVLHIVQGVHHPLLKEHKVTILQAPSFLSLNFHSTHSKFSSQHQIFFKQFLPYSNQIFNINLTILIQIATSSQFQQLTLLTNLSHSI